MGNNNLAIVDNISEKVLGLIAIFDLTSALDNPSLRNTTVSAFSFFVMNQLDEIYQEINKIDRVAVENTGELTLSQNNAKLKPS